MTRPDKIVETGVYRGISTAFMLAALEDNRRGRLWSVDLPNYRYTPGDGSPEDASPLFGRESTGFVVPAGLRPLWDLRLGDVRVVLPRLLTELTSIDLFYHDSAHTYDLMTWEYELAYAHLRPGGILTSDDVHWNSAFVDFTQKERFDWTHIFRKRLGVAILPA
jgi:predicted O-methyltransferase YrrM